VDVLGSVHIRTHGMRHGHELGLSRSSLLCHEYMAGQMDAYLVSYLFPKEGGDCRVQDYVEWRTSGRA
jgi:hypothetical protein